MIFSFIIRYSLHICHDLKFNTLYKSQERNLKELLNIRYGAFRKRERIADLLIYVMLIQDFLFEPAHQMCETLTGTIPHSILSEFATPMQLQPRKGIWFIIRKSDTPLFQTHRRSNPNASAFHRRRREKCQSQQREEPNEYAEQLLLAKAIFD